MTVARRALVSGRVQGVGFRYSCIEEARRIGVAGWVRNLADGRVEAHLEGEAAAVDALVSWLHEGPPFARVDSVEVRDTEPIGATSFGLA
ncbi:acylphosphatase [Naasia sp. SYSU D00948]|uniref:acylphosphatase n=1 Tax=Naasia sp. SYSU D00948 TaxID=2817379 RepID=UPI001B314581|nr:acylphosphatase [Naasia sp. SYSU D00948]